MTISGILSLHAGKPLQIADPRLTKFWHSYKYIEYTVIPYLRMTFDNNIDNYLTPTSLCSTHRILRKGETVGLLGEDYDKPITRQSAHAPNPTTIESGAHCDSGSAK